MRVSVVIPTYNSGPLVIEAVESVLAQTYPAAQIIVVDDGSTDDTPQRLHSFGDRIEYVRQANARVAAARNTGLTHASGDAVAFLDADDHWHPAKLERQIAALQERPEIGLVATDTFPWPGSMPVAEEGDNSPLEILPLSRLLVCNPLTTSSIIVRRSILAQAGRFDTELHGPEDFDLWLRCARIASVAVLRKPLAGYRDTAGSLGK
ncbi:MAG: glycosyltransferase, partial [Pirellulaceae bacterium]